MRAILRCLVPSLFAVSVAVAAAPRVPTLAPESLRPGQKAVVRTVFAGDSVESFDAEIVGVVPGGRAEGDLILARATSPRVERTGVAQGMSGSPVYVDGKLIGALSSGWAFSREPLFGITPIAEMLAVLDEPEPPVSPETAGPVGADPLGAPRARLGEYRWAGDEDDGLAPSPSPLPRRGSALGLPLAMSGAAPGAAEQLAALFEPAGFAVVPGGRDAAATRPRPLEPGDAVAVDVLRGDLNLSALGTVTYRDGDRVLLFGHPFFHSGQVRLPLSNARITTVMGSVNTSFKIGTPGAPVGTATQDRRAAVAGRLGPSPALMPLRVVVSGTSPREQRFTFQCIEDRALLPQLVSAAVVNSLLESGGSGVQQSAEWSVSVWRGGRSLQVGDLAAGDAPFNDVLSGVAGPLRFLGANPFTRFRADSVVVRLEVRPGRAQSSLRAASLSAPSARPGGSVRVLAQLERWRGEREQVTLDLPVPEELPDGRYVLHLGGGPETDRYTAARLPARFRVVSLEDAWQRLGRARRSDALHVTLWARAPEVNADGDDLPELPVSALAVLGSAQQAGDRARRGDWALVEELRRPLDRVVRGELLLELVVDRNAR